MTLPTFFLKIIAFFQAIISFLTSGVFWTEVTTPSDPVVIPPPEQAVVLNLDNFTMTWSDEFDGSTVDTAKWTGYKCGAEQSKTRMGAWWNTDMASVKDGNLLIQTKYYDNGYKGGKKGWYSCGLCTDGLFEQTYGYFEIRCILPKGVGMWSAFWMMPHNINDSIGNGGVDGAEIDVYESPNYHYKLSDNVNVVTSSIHYDAYGAEHQHKTVCTPFIENNDPYETYTTYGVEWNDKEYIFYINGVETGRTDFGGASQVPEYMIVNCNVNGTEGFPLNGYAGDALTFDSPQPTDLVVDYVRVYQYNSLLGQ
jgi:beta-glucanase (GH16 family)